MNYSTEKFKVWRKRWKDALVFASGKRCQCCFYDVCNNALEFHHIDPTQKDFALGTLKSSPTMNEKISEELSKCVLVCSNCHKELHAEVRQLPKQFDSFNVDLYYSYLDENNASKRKFKLKMELFEEAKNNSTSFTACARYLRTDTRTLKKWMIENNIKWS